MTPIKFSLIDWNSLDTDQKQIMLRRPVVKESQSIKLKTQDIISEVREKGDAALRAFTLKFDQTEINQFLVTSDEIEAARNLVSKKSCEAIKTAILQIESYHQSQKFDPIRVMTCPGVFCERQPRPINRVGLYIPGGSAPLVSTVMMLAIPAKLAGCRERILVTPPDKNGSINPHILLAAKLCEVSSIFKVGGAQAIAALAYGTETIPKVDKIFGPGNAWVTQAKLLVAQDPEGAPFDLPAGPSELLIIADENSHPELVAADLLSQAEHGPESQVILVTISEDLAKKVMDALLNQLAHLPRRIIAEKALSHSRFIIAEDINQAIGISNQYAPEHLILNIFEAESWMPHIENAGAVFVGPWAAESLGDYVTGSNHVLPTYGYARSMNGLSMTDFMTFVNFQRITPEGLQRIGPAAEILADLEGLQAHKNAVSLRLSYLLSAYSLSQTEIKNQEHIKNE